MLVFPVFDLSVRRVERSLRWTLEALRTLADQLPVGVILRFGKYAGIRFAGGEDRRDAGLFQEIIRIAERAYRLAVSVRVLEEQHRVPVDGKRIDRVLAIGNDRGIASHGRCSF